MSQTLPDKYRVRTRAELEELAASAEPTKRGVLGALLRELGFDPNAILELKSKERVELILKTQEERGGSAPAPVAAPKDEAPKGKASPAAAATPTKEKASPPAAAPVDAPPAPAALEKKISELQAVVLEQGKALAKMAQYLQDAHYLIRLVVASNSDTNANAKDPEIREMLYGKLSDSGKG
jgi:hypothetical protein